MYLYMFTIDMQMSLNFSKNLSLNLKKTKKTYIWHHYYLTAGKLLKKLVSILVKKNLNIQEKKNLSEIIVIGKRITKSTPE